MSEILTYDEYCKRTYEVFIKCLRGIDRAKLDRWFWAEEQQIQLRLDYEFCLKKAREGIGNPFEDGNGYAMALLYE